MPGPFEMHAVKLRGEYLHSACLTAEEAYGLTMFFYGRDADEIKGRNCERCGKPLDR